MMAHAQQQDFIQSIKKAFPEFFINKKVLEIGSLDINGSVRKNFSSCSYIGIDVGPGPGVDVVCHGENYDASDGSFDTVISCEVMEHNPFWRETFSNMLRLCRPGGLIVMTCASTGRLEHGTRRTTPNDAPLIEWEYYENLKASDFRNSISLAEHLTIWKFFINLTSCDLYFVGFKLGREVPKGARAELDTIRWHYIIENLRNPKALVKLMLIYIMGEQRFSDWKRWRRQSVSR